MTSEELKILVVGPSHSGKTEIADILSSASKGFTGNCAPTVGLRILEFQTELSVGGLQANIGVQLWDASGDEKYSGTWPAIAKNADGALLVYNAYDKKQAHGLERYAREFTKELDGKQCLVIAHKMEKSEEKASRPKLSANIQDAKIVAADAKENLDSFNDQFALFLSYVYQRKQQKIEAKEKELISNQGK